MISAKIGHLLDKPLAPLAKRISLSPNYFTVAGFAVSAVAAAVISRDLLLGGILILAGGALDMLDGIVARVNERETAFGAFLDSVLDRYSDAFIFMGIAWHMGKEGNMVGVVLSLGTMLGALLTSYARARAEGAGMECRSGIMERPERVMLTALGALTGWIVGVLWIMFFLTHITVLQRILHVRGQQRPPEK
jgi:phosphatidylglycerophosphate synthase